MKKLVIGLLVGVLIGGVAGFAAGIIVFPYIFPPPPVNEQVTNKAAADILATAAFIHANPADPVHYGRGHAMVYEGLLHLDADFQVGPGPKYHVYLVPEANITPDTQVQNTMFIDLGRLKAFSGSQNYPIPEGVELRNYQSIVIWCEQFNVLISPAELEFSR